MTSPAGTDATGQRPATGRSRLPGLLVLTDRHQTAMPLIYVVAASVEAGARAVVLREKDLPDHQRRALAVQLAPVVHDAGGLLLSAGAWLPGVDGVHQPAHGPPTTPLPGAITGRSCHDAAELHAAQDDRVDYATVSPVYPSMSKPGYGPALGIDGMAALVAATSLPVYALGGVDRPEAVEACRSVGAHGVAVMGAIMRAHRPGPVVAKLLVAMNEDVA